MGKGADSSSVKEAPRKTGLLGSLWQGVKGTLRSASYFQMQKRASILGRDGLRPFLAQLAEQLPQVRVHVVAHSVGARLAAHGLSAPLEPDRRGARVASLTLLQAVMSHHVFTPEPGPYNSRAGTLATVPRRVDGPIIVTFSEYDKAAGVAYTTGTRVAGGDNDAPGEERSAIGALGHDGAQVSNAVRRSLGPVGTAYAFEVGRIFNFDASDVIASHGDVFHPEIVWLAVAGAMSPRI
jgi:pimeloyl-ACP methyl ester carboxylesterase